MLCCFLRRNLLAAAPQLQGVDPSLLNWAFSQAAASLGPALTHLAAANIQQAQQAQMQAQLQQAQLQQSQHVQQQAKQQQQVHLQAQQQQQAQIQAQQMLTQQKSQLQAQIREQQANVQQQLQKLQNQQQQQQQAAPSPPSTLPPPPHTSPHVPKPSNGEEQAKMFAAELKQAFDRHMQSLEAPGTKENSTSSLAVILGDGILSNPATSVKKLDSVAGPSWQADKPTTEPSRTEADNEGGTALLGFLSSLRKSYEDVIRDKRGFRGKSESSYDTMSNRAAAVTDSNSTQQRDSSVEDSDWNSDWNSDKKTDPSSSEDSDKEVSHREKRNSNSNSKGPPRKRMKMKKVADEIRKGPIS
jgi:hypothetical protein